MADFHDTQFYNAQETQTIWDPRLNANVQTGTQGPTGYIQSNPESYKGYTGAVNHVYNKPIGADAYSAGATGITTPTGPTGFNKGNYTTQKQRELLLGGGQYNPYSEAYNQQLLDWSKAARMIPGTRPDIGVLAGTGEFYNLVSGDEIEESQYGDYAIDPLTQALGKFASQGPITPSFYDAQQKGLEVSGRGYNYSGQATPQEQALTQRAIMGDPRAAQEAARLRNQRIKVNEMSGVQQFANKYFGPALVAGVGSLAGVGFGPIAGAGVGALGQGAMTKFKDPVAVGLGAAGGLAGGWAGGAAGNAMGLGPVATGALGGAGGSIGRDVGYGIGRGKFDPGQILRNAAIGGTVGAAGGAFAPSRINPRTGQEVRPAGPLNFGRGPGYDIGTRVGSNVLGAGINAFLPGGPQPPRRPQSPQQLAAERDRQRRLAQQRRLNPYQR